MSDHLDQIGRQTAVYSAGIIIGKIASFLMLPVYTRYLTPADYGVLELLAMTIDVIGMITGIGLVTGIFKFYSGEEEPAKKKAIISTAAVGVLFLATLTSLVGFVFSPQLSRLIFGSDTNLPYLRLYFLLFFLQNFEYVPLLLIRAENRTVLFVTINALKLLVLLSLNIFCVVYLGLGIKGVLISAIIVGIGVAIGLTAYLVRQVGIGFSVDSCRQMLAFGSPMMLWSLASFVLVFSDRFFLNYYTNTSTVGIYSLAYKFAFLLSTLAVVPFQTTWEVQRFEVAKRSDALQVYARVFLYMNLVIGCVGMALALFVRDVLYVMSDPAFLPAYRLVPLLIAAQVLFTWAGYWSLGLYITGRTGAMGHGAIVLVPVTLVLNYLLIPQFGMYGAAWATFAAYAIRFLWIYHFSQRHYLIRYRWVEMAKLYGVLGTGVALSFVYRPEHLSASVAWNTFLFLAAINLVYGRILSIDDRVILKTIVKRYFASLLQRRAEGVL